MYVCMYVVSFQSVLDPLCGGTKKYAQVILCCGDLCVYIHMYMCVSFKTGFDPLCGDPKKYAKALIYVLW
jgi:hypothetical protein